MARLVPCPSCARHVRLSEAACPFCAAALSELSALVVPPLALRRPPGNRLTRAALVALGTSVSVAACGGTTDPLDGGAASDAGDEATMNVAVPYGVPARDAAIDVETDAPVLVDAAYGGPPQDAGDGGD